MPDNLRGARDYRGPNVARRRLLVVAAGGVMVGLGTVLGGGGGHPAAAAADSTASGAAAHPATQSTAGRSAAHEPTGAAASGHPHSSPRPAGRTPADGKVYTAADSAPRQPLYYVDDGPKVIALTIDDGPSPVYTPQVLRILEKYRVQATFSMIGENVGYYPSIAKEVAQAGHAIVNHTWDHANLTTLSASAQRTEIARAADAIHAAVGVHPHMFRAPYGAWTPNVLRYCASEGLIPLDWSVDPRDWSRPGVNEIVRTIMRTTQSGSIILEHDGGGDRAQTVAALKIVIPRLLGEGYRFAVA
jgi:peptidoglycan/xylan/chitin deacetylase (PgdA/CDA1 family)